MRYLFSYTLWQRLTLSIGLILTLITPATNSYAASANKLYMTPPTSQLNIGQSFEVTIKSYADVDQPTGSISGTITYPSDRLQVLATSTSGSSYNSMTVTPGSGTIGFSGSRNPAPSGTQQVFIITFKAVAAGSGTIVRFTSDSKVNNSTTDTSALGNYTIVNPNPPPSTPPAPTPKPSSSTTPIPVITTPVVENSPSPQESEPQPTPDPTGLVDSVVVNPLYATASVTWRITSPNGAAQFVYGTSSSQMDKNAAVTKNADNSFSTSVKGLTPGTRYYFRVTATADGGKTGTYSGVIIARGFPVTITVTENNVPAKNAQVSIKGSTSVTNADGKVTIGLASGSYSISVTTETASQTYNLTVAAKPIPEDGTQPQSQSFAYNLTSSVLDQGPNSGFSILTFIGILLGGTVLLALGFVGFMAYRRHKFESEPSYQSVSSPTVIVEDGYDWQQDQPHSPVKPLHFNDTISSQYDSKISLGEEEPEDMFEKAANIPLPKAHTHQVNHSAKDESRQNPNSPHSTTL